MRLVPCLVAWFPTHFCHYNSRGNLFEVSAKLPKSKGKLLILKWHMVTLIPSMHWNGSGTVAVHWPVPWINTIDLFSANASNLYGLARWYYWRVYNNWLAVHLSFPGHPYVLNWSGNNQWNAFRQQYALRSLETLETDWGGWSEDWRGEDTGCSTHTCFSFC